MNRRKRNRSDFKTERQFQRREGNFNYAISGDSSPRQSLFPQFRRKTTICRETPFIETITIYEKPAISEWDKNLIGHDIFIDSRDSYGTRNFGVERASTRNVNFRDDRNFQEPRHFRGKNKDLTMQFHLARFRLPLSRDSQFENGGKFVRKQHFY